MPAVVMFDEFGGPEVLRLDDQPVPEPAAGEVRVRIEAAAVNPIDLMMRAGHSPAPVPLPHARLGVEGTGVIDALGAGVSGLTVGDAVILTAIPDASARGSYAQFVTAPAERMIPRPPELNAEQAAAVWVAFSTAHGALIERAGLRPGDHLLITAASGSVGHAAIQIANYLGAVPVALTRGDAKRELLLAAGAAAVISTDREDVAPTGRELTGGTGADVVLDLVMGPGQQQLIAASRPGATLVAAGSLDPRPTPFPMGQPIRTFNYRSFDDTLNPVVVRRMAAFLNAALHLGALQPAIDRAFPLEAVADAHRHLESGDHSGKVVLTI